MSGSGKNGKCGPTSAILVVVLRSIKIKTLGVVWCALVESDLTFFKFPLSLSRGLKFYMDYYGDTILADKNETQPTCSESVSMFNHNLGLTVHRYYLTMRF